jgi:hypothetical protein
MIVMNYAIVKDRCELTTHPALNVDIIADAGERSCDIDVSLVAFL